MLHASATTPCLKLSVYPYLQCQQRTEQISCRPRLVLHLHQGGVSELAGMYMLAKPSGSTNLPGFLAVPTRIAT
jgi:hypothetical protein